MGNEKNAISPELSEIKLRILSIHTLWTFHCTPSRNSLSGRETIETHSSPLSDFNIQHEIIHST
jgi:hypothetical protein